jgi:hypothetical protein
MPETIEIDNLYIDDSAFSEMEHELYLFADPCAEEKGEKLPQFEKRPFPYILSRKVICKSVMVASKKEIEVSTNQKLFSNVKVELSN